MFSGLIRGKLLNVVVVHSKLPEVSSDVIRAFYEYSLEWMAQLNVEPKSISFLGARGFVDADNYPFLSSDKKIRDRGFKDISHITLKTADMPGTAWLKYRQPKVEAMISCNKATSKNGNSRGETNLVWCWENDRELISQKVVREFFSFSKENSLLDYGFAFSDYARKMPEVIEALRSPFQERSKITWTGDLIGGMAYSTKEIYDQGKHPRDFLQEVYPYQILSSIHLHYQVENKSLKKWIDSSNSHGVLTEFGEGLWFWEISLQEIDAIRKVLIKHNLLTFYFSDLREAFHIYGK